VTSALYLKYSRFTLQFSVFASRFDASRTEVALLLVVEGNFSQSDRPSCPIPRLRRCNSRSENTSNSSPEGLPENTDEDVGSLYLCSRRTWAPRV